MSRFFVDHNAIDAAGSRIRITGEDVRHIRDVLRSVPGDMLQISDGCGTDFDAVIASVGKDAVVLDIVAQRPNRTESPIDIILMQGIPKSDKMDFIIQKCIELGVKRIVPVITERTVVRFGSSRDGAAKSARWRRIALEAAKQCDRGVIPAVDEPVRLAEAIKLAEKCELKIIPYEEETEGSLRLQLEKAKADMARRRGAHDTGGVRYNAAGEAHGTIAGAHGLNAGAHGTVADTVQSYRVAVLIGPEGGFDRREVDEAVRGGFVPVTLGPRILRTDTAGVAVVSIIGYELGDINQN